MDKRTLDFYNKNYKILQKRYSSVQPEYLEVLEEKCSTGSNILDIGSGSGRDLSRLISLNFNAYGLEPSKALLRSSIDQYKNIRGRVLEGSIPDAIPEIYKRAKWNVILLSAILQHIPDSKLEETITTIYNLLNPEGLILISVPRTYSGIEKERDKDGRLFLLRDPQKYQNIIENIGFTLLDRIISDDALGRDNIAWTTLLFKRN